MPPPTIELRPATENDRAPMFEILAAAMRDYVERTWGPWDPAWQWNYFHEHFIPGNSQVVLVDGSSAGYLQAVREADHIFLDQIILAPQYHGRGIGTSLLRDLLAEASRAKLPLRLRVLKVNPARRLYERLGFVVTGEIDTHFLMEAKPQDPLP